MGEMTSAETIREAELAQSGKRCCMCAAHIGFQVEVVPIVPLNEGGAFVPANLIALCAFCRWLVQRQKVAPAALKSHKKQWFIQVKRAAQVYREHGLTIHGHPLRLEAIHAGVLTVLEGSELTTLLANFFNCLDTFLIHEDQHLENAASLAVIRAFRDMYNYIPPEQDIKDHATADSRKLDLLYRGIRALFSVGLSSKAKPAHKPATAKPPPRPKARKTVSKHGHASSKPAKRPVKAAARKKAAERKPAPPARKRRSR